MKVRITNGHCLSPGVDVAPGDVLDLEEKHARRKIAMGWAVPVKEPEATSPGEHPGETAAVPAHPPTESTSESDGTEPDEGEETEGTTRGRGRSRRS